MAIDMRGPELAVCSYLLKILVNYIRIFKN